MKTLVKLLIVASSLLAPAAWSAVITISFDESANKPTIPSGVAAFQTGALVLCDAFDAAGVAGCSGINISDLVVFGKTGEGAPTITYFSQTSPGQLPGSGAEIGILSPFLNVTHRIVLETVNESGTEVFTYSPTASDPGGSLVASDSYVYQITSDVPGEGTVPEPGTLLLLAVAGLAWLPARAVWGRGRSN